MQVKFGRWLECAGLSGSVSRTKENEGIICSVFHPINRYVCDPVVRIIR